MAVGSQGEVQIAATLPKSGPLEYRHDPSLQQGSTPA